MEYTLDDVHNFFHLPIYYNKHKQEVSEHIMNDLELSDANRHKSLYNSLFTSDEYYGNATSDMWSEFYTNDTHFLKDTQLFLKKKMPSIPQPLQCWNKIKGDIEFHDRYQYINFKYLNFLNRNSIFWQLLCVYRFASPIISLVYPIFVLLIPLLVLKYYNGLNISMQQYYSIMKMFIMNNSLVKLFTEFSIVEWRQSFYLLFSAGMYLFSIYQNILSCVNFHRNMKRINNYIIELTTYIRGEIVIIDNIQSSMKNLTTYQPFLSNTMKHREILSQSLHSLKSIRPYNWSYHSLSHMGYALKVLYFIYYDEKLHDALMYSFGLNGFLSNVKDIQCSIKNKYICKAKYGKTTKFTKSYYPLFKDKKHTKNTYSIKKSHIISGPNASGKTTLIKTTLFNVLLSQQIGYGFFEKATIRPYKYIHSYLNIPDTSDRDSLFQAEARRCREIISAVDKNKNDSHFCIFDELYSGTNPYEANASAYAFIKYISTRNIDFMMTTHFVELCDNLTHQENVKNYQMKISKKDDVLKYHYKLMEGISTYRGGIHVLKQLEYPHGIIKDAKRYLRVVYDENRIMTNK